MRSEAMRPVKESHWRDPDTGIVHYIWGAMVWCTVTPSLEGARYLALNYTRIDAPLNCLVCITEHVK
jgi:hypothetical protein